MKQLRSNMLIMYNSRTTFLEDFMVDEIGLAAWHRAKIHSMESGLSIQVQHLGHPLGLHSYVIGPYNEPT